MVPRVQPNQMLGLEINAYAAELARTSLWIGYIQWHLSNGIHYRQTPILTPMDTIRQTDAILAEGDTENPQETEWPAAEFIIGNPPFLGQAPMLRSNLGDEYVERYSNATRAVTRRGDIVLLLVRKARDMIRLQQARRWACWQHKESVAEQTAVCCSGLRKRATYFLPGPDQPWVLEGRSCSHLNCRLSTDGRESPGIGRPNCTVINSNLTMWSADLHRRERL